MPPTLLPPPNEVDRKAGWSIAYSFLTAIQSAAQRNRNEPVSLEIVEAVLLAAEATMLQNAGQEVERPVERPAQEVPEPYRLGRKRWVTVAPAVQQLAPAVPVEPERRSGAISTWLFISIVALLLIGFALWPGFGKSTPTETGVDGWVSGIDTCPTSKEYGLRVVDWAHFLRKPEYDRNYYGTLPHGTKVEVLSKSESFYRVRYKGNVGYVNSVVMEDYDPATGLRPDKSTCFGG